MRLALSLVIFFSLVGCSSALPCQNCPPLDGIYAVSWSTDGGTGNAQCPGPRVATWTFAQRQAQVTSTIGEVTLGGTYFDSYDLVMTGSTVGRVYRLKTLVIPEGTSLDAGVRLQGTFTASSSDANGGLCESAETFTAQRTSR